MWFTGVEVEQETSAPPPKKIRGSAPAAEMPTSGHYMKSYMMYILSKFAIIVLMAEIIFVSD